MRYVLRGVLLVSVAACGGDDDASVADAAMAETAAPDATAACANHAIFLNRGGGDFGDGATNDSSTNTSTLLNGAHAFAPFSYDGTTRADLLVCVADKFAPFDVVVTDVDPGTCEHLEVLFSTPADWQAAVFPQGGSFAPFVCMPVPRAIVFANPTPFGMSAQGVNDLCESLVLSVGISQGLEHEVSCEDSMGARARC